MKFLLSVLIVLVLGLGAGLLYVYDELKNLAPNIELLKAKNLDLTKRNKQLTKQNKEFSKKNTKLQTQRQTMRQKIRTRRINLSTQKLQKAGAKLISAAPKMVPFAGIPLVTASTAYDIKEYCDEVAEMERFEYALFDEPIPKHTQDKICGVDIKRQLQQTAIDTDRKYKALLTQAQKEQVQREKYWSEAASKAAQKMHQQGILIKKGAKALYNDTVRLLLGD